MKLSVVASTGLFAVAFGTKPKQCNKKCFNAIVSDTPPDLGQAFCSLFLSIEPLAPVTATVTVTTDAVVTTTNSHTETTTTTEVTTGTTVTTITGTVTQFAKRAQSSSDPVSASILSACKTKSALIGRICSSLLTPASAATTTLTVAETSTQTTVVEYTTTAVETTTETLTATTAAVATQSISGPIIIGGFDGGTLSPWISSVDTGATGGRVEALAAGNVCVDTGSNCHQSALCHMTAPTTGERYVAISQTFTAAPSTTYKLSILLNCRYGGAAGTTGIQALYQGADLGTYEANASGVELYFKTISVWEFTTDASGTGKLEIRVRNRGGAGGEYNYLDDITVTRKST